MAITVRACNIEEPRYSVKKSTEILNSYVYFGTSTSSIRTLNFFVYARPFSRITSFCWFISNIIEQVATKDGNGCIHR